MANCFVNNLIDLLADRLNIEETNGKSGDELISTVYSFLKEVLEIAKDNKILNLSEYLSKEGFAEELNGLIDFYNIRLLDEIMIYELIAHPDKDYESTPIKDTTSLDIEVNTPNEFSNTFLEDIFKGEELAKNQAIGEINFNLCNCCIFNRNTGSLVLSTEIDNNIKLYQERLFKVVREFINLRLQASDLISGELFDENGNYTGIFELNFRIMSEVFDTFDKHKISRLYDIDSTDLKAYYAFLTLLHFDEFLINTFGKSISISDMSKRFDKLYKIRSTTTEFFWNNLSDDDIDLSKSFNKVSRLIIESTRKYNTNNEILKDQYTSFELFIHIIREIRNLAMSTRHIYLNQFDNNGIQKEWKGINNSSLAFIRTLGENATLSTLISNIRNDAEASLAALFDLLTNCDDLKYITKTFIFDDHCILRGLYNEIFGWNTKSLKTVNERNISTNLFNYILSTVDSIYPVRNCAYTQNEEGYVELQEIGKSNIDSLRRDLNDSLNILNSPLVVNLSDKYNVKLTENGFEFEFKYNNNVYKVEITSSGTININGEDLYKFPVTHNIKEILLPFIDDLLHQDFEKYSVRFDNYKLVSQSNENNSISLSSENNSILGLFRFAAKLLLNLHIAGLINKMLETDTSDDKQAAIEEFISNLNAPDSVKNRLRVKFNYNNIDLIPNDELNILENLAEAKAITNGLYTSQLDKDSEGKALANTSPSRLLGSYLTLWETILKNPNSPANHFLLLNSPDILQELYTVREIKLEDGSKQYISFNTREFTETALLYDYLLPLIRTTDAKKFDLLKTGLMAITTSVNSDKPTITKAIINLVNLLKFIYPNYSPNSRETILEFFKEDDSALQRLINTEFGTYYNKLVETLNDDLKKLSSSLTWKSIMGDFILEYTPESFNEFNRIISDTNYSIREFIEIVSDESGVQINEPLHIEFTKSGIQLNKSIISLKARFNDDYLTCDRLKIPNATLFWKYKYAEFILDSVKNNSRIDLLLNETLYKFVENNFKDWISDSGELIYGKFVKDGKTYNITSDYEVKKLGLLLNIENLQENLGLIADNLVINPLLSKYVLLDYLISEEFILSTVGSHVNHPSKSKNKTAIIWGHPAIGKTYALNENGYGSLIMDWDVEFNPKRDTWISKITNTELGTKEFKAARNEYIINYALHPDYIEFVKSEWKRIKALANSQNKILIASPHMLLNLFADDFDKVLTMSQDDFVKRNVARKANSKKDSISWKKGIDVSLEKFSANNSDKIIMIKPGTYLSDILENNILFNELLLLLENYIKNEASRYLAQHKRNVSNTASVYEFRLNQLNGVPSVYNIAILQDINDCVYNLHGETSIIKPFDGATFVNPFVVVLENNSLNGESAGTHKKLFVHFYDTKFAMGGIIKTAGFGISNGWLRNSPFLERMFRNMCDYTWKNKSGESIYVDITKANLEINLENNSIQYEQYFKQHVDGETLYFKIKNIEYLGEGKYQLTAQRVTKTGVEMTLFEPVPIFTPEINSNYKVWKYIFQGTNAVGMDTTTGKLALYEEFGETSIHNVVKAMNRCGFGEEINLESYYLPMKHSDVHYGCTEGSVKQYTANFNRKNVYYDENGYRRFLIRMTHGGIQLDKTHQADNSEISMMTLVVSACAALGYTWNEANKLYQALYKLSESGLKPLLRDLRPLLLEDMNSNKLQEFRKSLIDLILLTMATSSRSKDGIVYTITEKLIEKYNKHLNITNDDIETNPIPISSPDLFNKVLSILASNLTKLAVKLKFSGILSVLVPSHEIMKIYGDKLYSDFKNPSDIDKLQLEYDTKHLHMSEVLIGRTYKIRHIELTENGPITKERLIHIQSPTVPEGEVFGNPKIEYMGYYTFKKLYTNSNAIITEYIKEGRNLGSYNIFFTDESGNKYNLYDLEVVYNMHVENNDDRTQLQELLANIKNGFQVNVRDSDGDISTVTVNNLRIQPYELIMPKIFAEKLGILKGESLSDLVNDPFIFRKKLINNLSTKIDDKYFSVALKKLNGKHLYILDKSKFKNASELEKAIIPPYKKLDGNLYRTDFDGKELYLVSSSNDTIYTINDCDVIVTDNIDFYLENSEYNTIYVPNLDFDYIHNKTIKNKSFNIWKNTINKKTNLDFNKISVNQNGIWLVDGKVVDTSLSAYINDMGDELYTSFKKTLDVVAARIPAQSMQSFMPMRVVAYEDSGVNNAYVSTHLIWLQGSDFDIDCVSLLTYELGKDGKFVGWSPLFDYSSEETLRISTELSYPSGEKILKIIPEVITKELLETEIAKLLNPYTIVKLQNKNLEIRDFRELVKLVNSTKSILDFESISKTHSELLQSVLGNIEIEQWLAIIKEIEDTINSHNLYSKNQSVWTKNYVVELIFRIIMNPANQIQAMTSVDSTTKELKQIADMYSSAGKQLERATPGNPINKFQSIEDNYVGKEVIGITAVGLKSFFGLTHMVNTILNTGNEEQILKLFGKPITFRGKEYGVLANVRGKNINKYILDRLNLSSKKDAALLISALLSLATDNAKELCLAKLNANAKLVDMYIYGLAIGIDFIDLGLLIMSDIGNIVVQHLKGSIISDDFNMDSVDKVLEFLENPITSIKSKYESIKLLEFNTGKLSNDTVWRLIIRKFTNVKGLPEVKKYFNDKERINIESYLRKFFDTLHKSESAEASLNLVNEFEYVLNIFTNLILSSKEGYNSNVEQNKFVINRFKKDLLQIAGEIHRINQARFKLTTYSGKSWDTAFEDFKTLRKGAAEFSIVGRLFGVNQGVKTTAVDYIKYINDFEEVLIKQSPNAERINFIRFMEDPNYRQDMINRYDDIMHTFNPLKAVTTDLQYFGYLTAVYAKHKGLLASSILYRTLNANSEKVKKTAGFINLDRKLKSLISLTLFTLINDYMLSKGLKFLLEEGLQLITLSEDAILSKKHATNSSMEIFLGTLGGNATFKNWVELIVIPTIKEGKLDTRNGIVNIALANNIFVQSLRPNVYTKNPSKNTAISYTLDIDMSPRNEADKNMLNKMIHAFDSLASLYFTQYDSEGNKFLLPLRDIFFWYNLIAYNGAKGSGTLSSIFTNYIESGQYNSYNSFILSKDWSSEVYNFTESELAPWVALYDSPSTSYSQYIYRKNRKNFVSLLLRKEIVVEEGVEVKKYVLKDMLTDPNLILHRPTSPDIQTIKFDLDGENVTVTYDPVTQKITSVKHADLDINIDKFTEVLRKYDPVKREYVLDSNAIKSIIKRSLYC